MKILVKIPSVLLLIIFLGVSVHAKPLLEDEIIENDLENRYEEEYEARLDDELAKEDKAIENTPIEERHFLFKNEEDDKDIEEIDSEEIASKDGDDSEMENPEDSEDSDMEKTEDSEGEKVIDEEAVEQSGDEDDDKDIVVAEGEERKAIEPSSEEDDKDIDVAVDEEILGGKSDISSEEPSIAWHEKVRRYFANWGK